jgi:hypothetical protein
MQRGVFVAVFLVPAYAAADCPQCAPITSRDYAIDLYSGVPIGNGATIGMGGAATANAMGSSGTLVNVSAPAVRPTTDTDWWSLDVHFDALSSSASTDNWNDGIVSSNGAGTTELTLGAALRFFDWAGAITFTYQFADFAGAGSFVARTGDVKVAFARWLEPIDMSIGVAVRVADLSVAQGSTGLFDILGVGAEAGAQWIPRRRDFRIGVAAATPIAGGSVSTTACDPSACMIGGTSYMLPDQVYVPWRVAIGGAYRFGPSRWNQMVTTTFRDEQSLTLVADVVATGSAPNGYGLEAFTQDLLERSGRSIAWSVRGGAEWECLPGRLRVRAGSYYEPARFDGVSGRVHGTFGIDLRLIEAYVWGYRRGRIGVMGDLAERYNNFSVSIGFWH